MQHCSEHSASFLAWNLSYCHWKSNKTHLLLKSIVLTKNRSEHSSVHQESNLLTSISRWILLRWKSRTTSGPRPQQTKHIIHWREVLKRFPRRDPEGAMKFLIAQMNCGSWIWKNNFFGEDDFWPRCCINIAKLPAKPINHSMIYKTTRWFTKSQFWFTNVFLARETFFKKSYQINGYAFLAN